MKSPENIPQAEQRPENLFRRIFDGKMLTPTEEMAVNILSSTSFSDLDSAQKMIMFEYSEFQELGQKALIRKKELFGEIREDELIRIHDRLAYDDALVERYDEFYNQLRDSAMPSNNSSVRIINLLREGLSLSEAADELEISVSEAEKIFINYGKEKMLNSRPGTDQIAILKTKGMNNVKIAEELGLNIKYVETAVRALIFFGEIPPTPSGKSAVRQQDRFLMRVAQSRFKTTSNEQVAQQLNADIGKVEDATRFLLWIGLINPIGKSDAGKTRWKHAEHKEEVKKYLNSLDPTKRISLRAAHQESGIPIGYDLFCTLYFELSSEQKVPPVRNYSAR